MSALRPTVLAFAAVAFASAARAESVADFYKKTPIEIIIGYNPGGTYDIYARMAARYMPKYIPGNPSMVPKNMPGVGSVKATNFLFSQAARDGSVIGVIGQYVALQQVLKHRAVHYDARKFDWIGRMTNAVEVSIAWHTSPVKTIQDAMQKELVVGATSAGSSADTAHKLMNAIAGTKFKIVLGYKGTTGAMMAMERGEVQGSLAVVQSLLVTKKPWLDEKKINVLVQYSTKRHPAFPNAPAMTELGKSDEDKQILNLYGSTAEIGRALMTPPGLPPERLALLQKAFEAMLKDKGFIAQMKTRNMELDPMSGPELKKLVNESFSISPKAAARAAAARN
ncbi:MAG: Bug family tripartite tricarboxylate transporter substrate binding protein [Beijerinckiaceae bacterium]